MSSRVIAIDGPAGSGKSTLARALAVALDLPYVNTGLMYRALTAKALDEGVETTDALELRNLLQGMVFGLTAAQPAELTIDGAPPAPELTGTRVEGHVSAVARHPAVRALMVGLQRELGAAGAVMEGRDIATTVFPDAALKVYLDAAEDVRAERRAAEREDDGATIAKELQERDRRDARTNAQEPSDGAIVIDTTGRSAEDVADEVLALARERLS